MSVELNTNKLDNLIKGLKSDHYVDVGVLGEKAASDENGITIAGYGAVNEFGSISQNIPERSFIRMPLETGQDEIEAQVAPSMLDDMANGDTKKVFKKIGIAGEGRVQKAFETSGFGKWEPNAEITVNGGWMRRDGKLFKVKGKKSDKPLIDTGKLRQAITSKVGP